MPGLLVIQIQIQAVWLPPLHSSAHSAMYYYIETTYSNSIPILDGLGGRLFLQCSAAQLVRTEVGLD